MKPIQKFLARRFLRKEVGEDLLAFVMSKNICEQRNFQEGFPFASGGSECGKCHRKSGALRMDVAVAQLLHHHICLKGFPPAYLCSRCLDEWLRTCGFVCPHCHRAMRESFVGWEVKEMTLAPSLKTLAVTLPSGFVQVLKVMPALRDYLSSHGRDDLAKKLAGLDVLCPNCIHDLLCAANVILTDKFLQIGYTSLEMESIQSHFEEKVDLLLKGLKIIGFVPRALNAYWGYEPSPDELAKRKRTEEKVEDFVNKHSEIITRVWNWLSERSGYGKSC